MSGTRSHSKLGVETPQYAYVLAILSGGVAFILLQIESTITPWLSYALLASLLSYFWPYRFWQWAIWLCLPLLFLILFSLLLTFNLIGVLAAYGMMFVKSSFCAYVGAYAGSKLSVRKLVNRSTHRRELKRGRTRSIPVSKESATPTKAVEAVSNLQDLNAALTNAVQEGDIDKIRLLIADGADVNARSDNQWTPQVIAALGFDTEAIKTMFGQGATMSEVGLGWTALMIATIEGRLEVVSTLLEHGAEVNAQNDQGWTALRFAVSMDDAEILRVLLDAGADANIPDQEGKTALMQAASENMLESLKILLNAGALPQVKDHAGQTALMIAEAQCHTEIVKLLEEGDASNAIAARVSHFA